MENFENLWKLSQIIFVDLVLAGDNAIIIGLVAAKFTAEYRRKVILYGVGVAVLLRIIFAVLTVKLLGIPGLVLVGGLLLLWVCWRLWVDLRTPDQPHANEPPGGNGSADQSSILASIMQIVLADLSMSLDNVLAVAGIADGHTLLLVVGLTISVAFMTFAAALIAEILQKNRWIGYCGLAVIVYVAARMIFDGTMQLMA